MANQYVKLLSLKKNYLLFYLTRNLTSTQTVSSAVDDKIIIPKRIPRSNVDILKALSSTVGTDPTAPAFKYIDDPFLIPTNRHQKLVYSLSKESGQKAAKYFMAKFPEFFIRDEAEPKIEAFHFKEMFDETMDLNEQDLQYAIENNQVDNAMAAFRNITSKGGKMCDGLKKNLLELVCFFNSLESFDPDLREKFVSEKTQETIWISDFAFEVFDSIENKDGEAYSIMIAGLCKHSSVERALQMHNLVKENNISLTIEAFNGLISSCIRGQSFDNRWSAIMDVIDDMNRHQVAPNLETFVNIFDILSKCKATMQVREKAKGLIGEMAKCKIKPSLAIYSDLLRIYTNGNNIRPRLLEEILDELGHKELTMRHEKDAQFFPNAMFICLNLLSDVELAYKLHDLVSSHRNYLLLTNTDLENRYYNNLFKLITKSESIDKTMEMYYKYVPNIYVPDTTTFIEILEAVELYQANHYIPQVCSDFILFEYVYSQNCTIKMLEILSRTEYPKNIQEHVNTTASEILRYIESKVVNSRNPNDRLNFDVAIFDKCLKIYSLSKDLTRAKKVLELYRSLKKNINGQPSFETMRDFVDTVIAHGTGKDLIEVVKTAVAYDDSSVISKAVHLSQTAKVSQNLLDRLEEIRAKSGIVLQDLSDFSESSSSSSESSDDDNSSIKSSKSDPTKI